MRATPASQSYSTSKEVTSYTHQQGNPDEDEAAENASIAMLTSMMVELHPDVARRVLRKCKGDIQKAASAILEGDFGEPQSWSQPVYTPSPPEYPERKAPQSSVIDLTVDESNDDDISRAVEASLQSHNNTKFGPSDRSPNPYWALVPTNAGNSSVTNEDRTLSRAIEESLSTSYNEFATDTYEDQPLEKSVREGGRPVALRPSQPTLAYAAFVLQALFAVPQVREAIAYWRPSARSAPPTTGSEMIAWALLELFANMDLAQLSSLVPDKELEVLNTSPWATATELPGDLSSRFFGDVAFVISSALLRQYEEEMPEKLKSRLFIFSYRRVGMGQFTSDTGDLCDDCTVGVDVGGDDGVNNDLVSRLSATRSRFFENGSYHEVILYPSEVIAFRLQHERVIGPALQPSSSSDTRQPFKFPKFLYMDQFLAKNFELANLKRRQQAQINAEVLQLTFRRSSITRFEGTDTLKDLYSSLHYYETLADPHGDPERHASIQRMAQKLKKIIETIEIELQVLDKKVAELNAESAVLFDCPELQRHKFDLRAVLMHDGLFGRRQLYSYVKDKGTWWKTVDTDVTEVSEETVLSDPTGLHLGAGPYMLIYSEAVPNDVGDTRVELPWPQSLKDRVMYHNQEFLSSLDPAIAAKATPLVNLPRQTPSRQPTEVRSSGEEMDVGAP